MRLFNKAKDGGPKSPVDAYFLIERKSLFSIALLKFNKGGREEYHTHAFNAYTWFLFGDLVEEDVSGISFTYKRGILPKITLRSKNHRVRANKTSYCLTIRGPWCQTWYEVSDDKSLKTTLTHGRKVVSVGDYRGG